MAKKQTQAVSGNKPKEYKVPFISAKIEKMSDNPESKIKAYASIVLGHHFAIKGFKVYDAGEKGLQVLEPSTKSETDGKYYKDAYPITKEARDAINKTVIDAYENELILTGKASFEVIDDDDPVFEQSM